MSGPSWVERGVALLAWQIAVSALLLLGGGVAIGLPAWNLGVLESLHLSLLWAAYLLSTAIPSALWLVGRRTPVLIVAALGAAGFYTALLLAPLLEHSLLATRPYADFGELVTLRKWRIPVPLVVVTGVLGILANLVLSRRPKRQWRLFAAVLAAAATLASLSVPGTRSPRLYRGLEQPLRHEVDTSLQPLQLNVFHERVAKSSASGGGLLAVDGKVLLVTGDGRFHLLAFAGNGERLSVDLLPYHVPMNFEEFGKDTPGLSAGKHRTFRTMDLLVTDAASPGGSRLLVSHHFWDRQRACSVVRISVFEASLVSFMDGRADDAWGTLFETQHCLRVAFEQQSVFTGNQAGGHMARGGLRSILLALGDHGFDGVHAAETVSQDMRSEYGKVVEVDLGDGSARIFSAGHRSPGGFHRDESGRLWLTEHGPQGGDELNLVVEGRNYGWPSAILGTEYGSHAWPGVKDAERGVSFQPPAFAWTPSIAPSALLTVAGSEFPRWQGELLVAGLASRALYRIHLEADQPVLSEPIPVHSRVRDMVLDANGRLVLWTDEGDIVLVQTRPDTEVRPSP